MTEEQLRQILPNAGHRAGVFYGPLIEAMAEFSIDTPGRQAAFIAQLGHESGSFVYMEELASGAAYDHRDDLGNTRPEAIGIARQHGSTPGRWWKGHGPMQITGFYNHRDCGEFLGLDLLNEPRLICEPVNGCRSAGWFWRDFKHLNEFADAGDFIRITKRINGGTNGLADRQAIWARAKTVLGA